MILVIGNTKKQLCNTVGKLFCSYLMTIIYTTLTKIVLLPTGVGGRFVVWLAMVKKMK